MAWFAPLLQTLIGAIAAIGGGTFALWVGWQKERQSVAIALAGEIQGFVGVLNWRNTRDLLKKGYKFPIGEGPFPVFAAFLSKIGYLPSELTGQVVDFYTCASGIAQDFSTLNTQQFAPGQETKFRENLIKGIDDLEAKAAILVPALRKEATRAWFRLGF
jgi:hypothetical protein